MGVSWNIWFCYFFLFCQGLHIAIVLYHPIVLLSCIPFDVEHFIFIFSCRIYIVSICSSLIPDYTIACPHEMCLSSRIPDSPLVCMCVHSCIWLSATVTIWYISVYPLLLQFMFPIVDSSAHEASWRSSSIVMAHIHW